ncbi:MAG: hypothetical protein C0621_10685 [Desulfuromonas sp.]|nr:MAG: hypothetical protein C0621_10685 [Desulfuromonas sp.]
MAVAAATPSTESFPTYLDLRYSDGVAMPVTDLLCSCENVYRPTLPAGSGILTLLTLDLADPLGDLQSVSILGNQGTVYASEENLYVVSTNSDAWLWWPLEAGIASQPSTTSQIHRFSLGATPRYAGSGSVPGWILNRYSLDEEGDVLGVATTEPGWVSNTLPVNRLTTLQLGEDELIPLGSLEGLGKPGESIFAVRLLGERGYVVTFLQTDPFYVLDLSDPQQPKTLGELEVPGFSTYLHPVDADHLLAIGRDDGMKLSLYNVQDGNNPTEVATLSLGAEISSTAEYDPHAFNYFSRNQMLAIPVTSWGSDVLDVTGYSLSSRLELFKIDPTSGITPYGQVDHSRFYREEETSLWYTAETVTRSYFASSESFDYLYSLSPRGLQVNRLDLLEPPLVQIDLPAEPIYWSEPIMTVTP